MSDDGPTIRRLEGEIECDACLEEGGCVELRIGWQEAVLCRTCLAKLRDAADVVITVLSTVAP